MKILRNVGNTPMIQINCKTLKFINLFAKLEYYNPTGSIKDRAANYIIKNALAKKIINSDTTLIESSSGNFGIALSAYSKKYNLKFFCVIDPHITKVNKFLINKFCDNVIKVTEPDEHGGYLLSRIKKVKELCRTINNSYWVNQYANELNAEAYYNTLGNEIIKQVDNIDYIFIGVSSGGTITGVSNKIKEEYPKAKVIAVDVEGSIIFGGNSNKRYIPGIGSSMVPKILEKAKIDDVVKVNEIETIDSCNKLLADNFIFAGGSSGSVLSAIYKYFMNKNINSYKNVVTIFPDRGERYIDTVYNDKWFKTR